MKKVSIIVPVWNVEKYLPKCLDSLVNQTLEDIEIIIVNDESPDNSQKIIDRYLKKYPHKVKALTQKNGGQGSARNYGLEHAEGEYVGYVDSDDYIELDMYEKMYNNAKENKFDIVFCYYNIVFENNNMINSEKLFLKDNDAKTNAFFNNVGVCNKIYKRELLKDIKFKSKVWYEDLAFTCKVIMNAKKIGFINEGLYNYLQRDGSTMNNNNIKRNLEILDAFDDVLDYINENKKLDKYYSQIEFLAIYHIYIAAVVRVINAKNVKDRKKIINTLEGYVEEKFPNYRTNKYLKYLDKNKKIIYTLISKKQYIIVRLIFVVKEVFKCLKK